MAHRRQRRRAPLGLLLGLVLALAAVAVGYWALLRRPETPEAGRQEGPPRRRVEVPRRAAPPEPDLPTAATTVPPGSRVAIVIDDLGRSLAEVERLERLGVPITFAVLPFERRTAEVVAHLRSAGAEILCHLPLEGRAGADPGPGAIRDEHSARRVARRTREAIEAVPGAVGLNNHMGSKVTADREAMHAVIEVVADRGLFFLDSRTTADSVAYELAKEAGVPTASRAVFLDGEREPGAIRTQFERLLELARARGAAIAIGHPHGVTFDALDALIPEAVTAGYEFVPVSYLLDREEGLPE